MRTSTFVASRGLSLDEGPSGEGRWERAPTELACERGRELECDSAAEGPSEARSWGIEVAGWAGTPPGAVGDRPWAAERRLPPGLTRFGERMLPPTVGRALSPTRGEGPRAAASQACGPRLGVE